MNEITAIAQPGLNLTASLMADAVKYGSSIRLSETLTPGFYAGTITNIEAGKYTVLVFNDITIVATGQLDWDGTAEINQATSINELCLINGLKQGVPLEVTTTMRIAGSVLQNIVASPLSTIVTRISVDSTSNNADS